MTNEFVRVASCIVALILLALVASLAHAQDRKEKRSATDFNMAAYLDHLSSKATQRGYKEFVYKQTAKGNDKELTA